MKRASWVPGLLILAGLSGVGCKRTSATSTAQSRELFVKACARCHGAEGTGGEPLWEAGPAPQNFHDHTFQLSRTDEQLRQSIKNGKGIGMPPFGSLLSDEQIAELVVQIRSFDTENKP